MKPIAIIGIGNFLMGDEGAGIHAAHKLRQEFKRDDCDVIDGGVPSISLLHMIEGRAFVIIIDCAEFGGKAGEIITFTPDQIKREKNSVISLHGSDLLSTLDVGATLGLTMPPVWIIGIQPVKIEMSRELSPEVRAAIDRIPKVIENILAAEIPSTKFQ
jgi:hydrogenase maturation protease